MWNISSQSSFLELKLGFTPCKVEQPLQGIELQEKAVKNNTHTHTKKKHKTVKAYKKSV